jgi:hypothetical protein
MRMVFFQLLARDRDGHLVIVGRDFKIVSCVDGSDGTAKAIRQMFTEGHSAFRLVRSVPFIF